MFSLHRNLTQTEIWRAKEVGIPIFMWPSDRDINPSPLEGIFFII